MDNNDKQLFTCIGRGHGSAVTPATLDEWKAVRHQPWLTDLCRRIEAGDDTLKRHLPIWTPHCADFRDGHRAKADALRPLPRLMLDFDEKGHSAEILEKALAAQQAGRWEVLLVEESVRRGTHVLVTLPQGMSAEEAQRKFSDEVGFEADAAVKDVSRCIYQVPDDHTLYINEERLVYIPVPAAVTENETEETPPATSAATPAPQPADTPKKTEAATYPDDYEGIPYPVLVEALAEQLGGAPAHGARNNFIFSMACHLRYVCNDDPAWITAILPTYGEAPDKVARTVTSACHRPQSRFLPRLMERAIDLARARAQICSAAALWSETPPPMPRRLPPLIKLLTSKVPEAYKPAVAHAVFPALGAHLGRVDFRYIDNVTHKATFMCCLLAKMSSGKSSVNKPIEYILADIVERDNANRLREQQWKDSLNTKGANKEKPKRPTDLCIQVLVSDMTNAAFVQRLNDANGEFLYTSMDELELMDGLKTSSRGNQVSQIIRLAFDCGLYGQERVGASSVTARVRVMWNWNASSTIVKGQRYFRGALADGTLSRINFCTILPGEAGTLPVYGTYDETFADELRPYIDNLNAAQGLVTCPQAERLAQKLLEENTEQASLSDDEAFATLSYRANVIAYLKAMTLYVAQGGVWDKVTEEFVRWSEQYDLWCKMRFFGEQMREDFEKENRITLKGPRNLLDLLPIRFSKENVASMRRAQGKSDDPSEMLRKWVTRGYITQDKATAEYVKSPKYLKKHGCTKVGTVGTVGQ